MNETSQKRLRLLFVLFVVCLLSSTVAGYASYLLGLASADASSYIAVFGIEVSFIALLIISFIQAKRTGENEPEETRAFAMRVLSWWLPFSVVIRFAWEFSWCLASFHLNDLYGAFFVDGNTMLAREQAYALMEQHEWTWIYVIYGVADARYLVADSFILSLELLVSLFGGCGSIYALYLSRNKRHVEAAFFFVFVAAVESFGTFMYFLTEIFNEFFFLDTENVMNWFFKFFGLNVLWIIAPFIALAHERQKAIGQDSARPETGTR